MSETKLEKALEAVCEHHGLRATHDERTFFGYGYHARDAEVEGLDKALEEIQVGLVQQAKVARDHGETQVSDALTAALDEIRGRCADLAAPVPAAPKPEEKTTVEKLTRNVNQRTWRDWLAVCRTHGVLPHPYGLIIAGLEAEIGSPPPGSHPDEAKPRGETWHAERANWQAEVERLRAAASDPLCDVPGCIYRGVHKAANHAPDAKVAELPGLRRAIALWAQYTPTRWHEEMLKLLEEGK